MKENTEIRKNREKEDKKNWYKDVNKYSLENNDL